MDSECYYTFRITIQMHKAENVCEFEGTLKFICVTWMKMERGRHSTTSLTRAQPWPNSLWTRSGGRYLFQDSSSAKTAGRQRQQTLYFSNRLKTPIGILHRHESRTQCDSRLYMKTMLTNCCILLASCPASCRL